MEYMKVWFICEFGAVSFRDVGDLRWVAGPEPHCTFTHASPEGPRRKVKLFERALAGFEVWKD